MCYFNLVIGWRMQGWLKGQSHIWKTAIMVPRKRLSRANAATFWPRGRRALRARRPRGPNVKNYVKRRKLFVILQHGTFTFQTRNMLSRSMIDHMFVLEGGLLSMNCEPIEHIDSGTNLSSHVPLLGKFNIGNRYSRKRHSKTILRKRLLSIRLIKVILKSIMMYRIPS